MPFYEKIPYPLRLIGVALVLQQVNSFLFSIVPPFPPADASQSLAASIPVPVYQLSLFCGALVPALFAKKEHAWPYFVIFLLPYAVWYNSWRGHFWAIIWMVFGMIPLLEIIAGDDKENPTEEEEKALLNDPSFQLLTLAWVPFQGAFLAWALWCVGTWQLSLGNYLLFAISTGFVTGILGINISHELIHKPTAIEKYFGKLLLAMVCYGHWCTEHLYGHHKEVSTPHDPATSKLGESFYSFWPRSVIGSFWSAWEIEKKRAAKNGYPLYSMKNVTIETGVASAMIFTTALIVFGAKAAIFFLIQSFIAFSLLEIVNYIEHYGLERKSNNGSYEPVNPLHSWNANATLTNFFLFKLQRHSDHHAFAARRYQILRCFDESPQMPTGYGGMLLLAIIPPIWFRVMNPRVKENDLKLQNSEQRKEWQKGWKAFQ